MQNIPILKAQNGYVVCETSDYKRVKKGKAII